MNAKLLAAIAVTTSVISVACVGLGGYSVYLQNQSSSKIKSLNSQISTLNVENKRLAEQEVSSAVHGSSSSASSSSPFSISSSSASTNNISTGQTVTIPDYCSFTITKAIFAKRVNPSNPGSYYTYYQTKTDDSTYLDIQIKVKNLQSAPSDADQFGDVTAYYDNNYTYTSFSTIETDNGSDLDYSNITNIDPLSTRTMHYLVEVPTQVQQTTNNPLYIIYTVKGTDYKLTVR